MSKCLLGCIVAVALLGGLGRANAQCTVPNTFSAGTTALSAQVNANFTAVTGCALPASGGTLTNGTLAGTTNLPGSGIITSAGLLGIGTTSPANTLEVVNTGTGGIRVSAPSPRYEFFDTSIVGANINEQFSFLDGAGTKQGLFGYQATDDMKFQNNYTDGGLAFTTVSATRMYINSAGNVGIGTTSPDILLTVGSTSASGNVVHFQNSTGSCYINPTSTSLSCSSDRRLKKNVAPLGDDALSGVMALDPVHYTWRKETAGAVPHTGFIAQDVEQVFADLVSHEPDGHLALNYAGLTPYLTKAIQQQQAEIVELRAAVRELAAANDNLRIQVAKMAHGPHGSSASLASVPATR